MTACGLFNINKPAGMTSRRVVDIVQRAVRPAKAGHAGTLDPLATGVLVVCAGAATRLIEYVQRMPKSYTATFLLGRQSPSEDVESEVTALVAPPVPTHEDIVAAAAKLVGPIQQRPPAYSALKVDGRRAYALARKGRQVDLKPRTVMVHRLEVVAYAYPELTLAVDCGSGTYIRSLGRDLAESLDTAAVMSALVRTAIGGFRIQEAVAPCQVKRAGWSDHLLPALRAVESLPRIELSPAEIREVCNGRTISRPAPPAQGEFAALDTSGRLIALLIPRGLGELGPSRVLDTSPARNGD
ncbi:MAG: tRNA pseudouridine(55) synthase TruB [Pirellulales bacterium]|nr:tRNA pseudouridine(55) synthase TruB [Pirellulales bacterium]